MEDQTLDCVRKKQSQFNVFVNQESFFIIKNDAILTATLMCLCLASLVNGTIFCSQYFCHKSLAFIPSIILILCSYYSKRSELIFRIMKEHAILFLHTFLIVLIFGFRLVASSWSTGLGNLPLMTYMGVTISVTGLWVSRSYTEAFRNSFVLTIVYIVLFYQIVNIDFSGLVIGSIIGCSIGSVMSILVFQSRCNKFYLLNINQLILDSIQNKTELDSNLVLPVDDQNTELSVTIVFFDIVRFSQLSSFNDDNFVFNVVKHVNNIITDASHKNGGKIDRSLGDGILAFFTCADGALNTAIEVQKNFILAGFDRSVSVFLRVGMNQCNVLHGNIGNSKRADFTVIGHGVNLAKRLEAACNPRRIMISESCMRSIDLKAFHDYLIVPTLIKLKHRCQLYSAYEVDIFHDSLDLLEQSDQHYWQTSKKEILSPRFKPSNGIRLKSDSWVFNVANLSKTGFKVSTNQNFAPNVSFYCCVSTNNQDLNHLLKEQGLFWVFVKVVWSKIIDVNQFELGFEVSGRHKDMGDKFMQCLFDYNEIY